MDTTKIDWNVEKEYHGWKTIARALFDELDDVLSRCRNMSIDLAEARVERNKMRTIMRRHCDKYCTPELINDDPLPCTNKECDFYAYRSRK